MALLKPQEGFGADGMVFQIRLGFEI